MRNKEEKAEVPTGGRTGLGWREPGLHQRRPRVAPARQGGVVGTERGGAGLRREELKRCVVNRTGLIGPLGANWCYRTWAERGGREEMAKDDRRWLMLVRTLRRARNLWFCGKPYPSEQHSYCGRQHRPGERGGHRSTHLRRPHEWIFTLGRIVAEVGQKVKTLSGGPHHGSLGKQIVTLEQTETPEESPGLPHSL